MDAASLQITFVPLIKKMHEESKCYLEIVPEVCNIPDEEIAEWVNDYNAYEYNIPLVYKVRLNKKKTESLLEIYQNVRKNVKAYHSCVDLIESPLISAAELASGDVVRHFSENLILTSKHVSNFDLNSSSNQIHSENSNYNDQEIQTVKLTAETLVKSQQTDIEGIDTDTLNNDYKLLRDIESILEASKLSIVKADKNINSEITYDGSKEGDQFDNSARISKSKPKNGSITLILKSSSESKKLCVSPICSIDTSDADVKDVKISTSSSIMYTQKTVHGTCIETYNYTPRNELNRHIPITQNTQAVKTESVITIQTNLAKDCSVRNHDFMNMFINYGPNDRQIPPKHGRINQLLRCIEKEILPVKLGLEDLLTKCWALGLKSSNGWIICNNKRYNSSIKETRKSVVRGCVDNKFHSNRVVYSYVFDG